MAVVYANHLSSKLIMPNKKRNPKNTGQLWLE
jgi:hypothetical protein